MELTVSLVQIIKTVSRPWDLQRVSLTASLSAVPRALQPILFDINT